LFQFVADEITRSKRVHRGIMTTDEKTARTFARAAESFQAHRGRRGSATLRPALHLDFPSSDP
jgi:hypothetical protein